MDAGDADVELVPVALDDSERVVAGVALRMREASTRALSRADEATAAMIQVDAGDADPEFVAVAKGDGERVLARLSLRVREASARASGRARGRGDDGWGSRMDAGDADVEEVVVAGLDGERVLVVAALRVREASTRASGGARADEATTGGELGWTRETVT